MDLAEKETTITLEQALRQANLLAAAAETSQNITRIMDIDALLPKTVDIVCEAYDFYYAGVFLIDEEGEYAVLRAGRGEPGRIMIENNHKLAVGGNSMIGACTSLNEARISLDVDTEKVWYPNPILPETRSEMALPLAIGTKVIGAVTVQSVEESAFSDEDVSSLQAMANQLAIAIDNARQRRQLEEAHAELLHAKTFEAIATATGDAIHWIGNKAEPIPGSVQRIEQDIKLFICSMADVLNHLTEDERVKSHSLAQLILQEANAIQQTMPEMTDMVEKLKTLAPSKLKRRLSLSSSLEDLQIINEAATIIMRVKEDMIGPAREQAPRPTMIEDVVKDSLCDLDIPKDIINVYAEGNLPLALTDPLQLNRVFNNLINNAYEAMAEQANPQIKITVEPDTRNEFIQVQITDNGKGIAEENLDKIWITFHTTKGIKGHLGLGLPACRLILDQIGGKISVASKLKQGTTFVVSLPIYTGKETRLSGEEGEGTIYLIDDGDNWRHFAATTLTNAGYTVTIASDDLTDNYEQYNLILMDDILSEKDATSILKTIKTNEAISKTVLVSSNPRVEQTKERKLMGVHNLLPKPYTKFSLSKHVKTVLRELV